MSNAVEVKFDDGSGAMCIAGDERILCNLKETLLPAEDFLDHDDHDSFHGFKLIPVPGEMNKFYTVKVSRCEKSLTILISIYALF